MIKRILIAALIWPLLAFAQTYPSPTYKALTLQNALPIASGGTGATTATGATSQLQYLQGATGSVARSLTSKFQDTVNGRDFGVKCDGSTDDTANIQAVITAVPAAGGTVNLPSGNCVVSNVINVTGFNVRLLGDSYLGTVIISSNQNAKILNVTGSNFELDKVSLSYSGALPTGAVATALFSSGAQNKFHNFVVSNAGVGIEIATNPAQFLYDFQVRGFSQIGIYIHNINDVYISQFVVDALTTTGGALGGMRLFNQAEAITVQGGSFLNGVYGITTDAASYAAGVRPAYNRFNNVYFDSAATNPGYFNNSIEFTFTGCWFSGGRSGGGGSGVKLLTLDSFSFSGSQFVNNGLHGAEVGAGASRVTFSGNLFESNSITAGNGVGHGIDIAAGVANFIAIGNTAHNGVFTGQQGYGVKVEAGASTNYNISNNLLINNFSGALSDSGTGTAKMIKGNTGYNPIASTAITVTASPFTYTNNTGDTVNVFVTGGTVSSVTLGGNTVATATNTVVPVPQGASVVVTYSVAPTMTYIGH